MTNIEKMPKEARDRMKELASVSYETDNKEEIAKAMKEYEQIAIKYKLRCSPMNREEELEEFGV